MKTIYRAIDGTEFDNIADCKRYEAKIQANLCQFTNSRIWDRFHSTPQNFDSSDRLCPEYLFVGKDEAQQVALWAKTRNRTFYDNYPEEGVIYLSINMTFYPIEYLIKQEKEKIKNAKQIIERYKTEIKKIRG